MMLVRFLVIGLDLFAFKIILNIPIETLYSASFTFLILKRKYPIGILDRCICYFDDDDDNCEKDYKSEILYLVRRIVTNFGRIPFLACIHEQPYNVQNFTDS